MWGYRLLAYALYGFVSMKFSPKRFAFVGLFAHGDTARHLQASFAVAHSARTPHVGGVLLQQSLCASLGDAVGKPNETFRLSFHVAVASFHIDNKPITHLHFSLPIVRLRHFTPPQAPMGATA
jgi:hypothetical protein